MLQQDFNLIIFISIYDLRDNIDEALKITEHNHWNAASPKPNNRNNERFTTNTYKRFIFINNFFPFQSWSIIMQVCALFFVETIMTSGKTFLKEFPKVITNNYFEYFKDN